MYENIFNFIIIFLRIINILISLYIIFFQKREVSKGLAWVLLLNFMPVTGIVLFVFAGRGIFVRKSKLIRFDENDDNVVSYDIGALTEYEKIINYNENRLGAVLTKYNHVDIFIDGNEKFLSVENDLKKAQRYIFIQYYIIRDDEVFSRIVDILKIKVLEGCQAFLLYDAIGCRSMKCKKWKELKALGIKVVAFSPGFLNKFNLNLNYRNHRKIIIIDGDIAFCGGINVGQEYIGLDKKFGHWRDTHFRLQGEAIVSLIFSFITDWNNFAAKEDLIKNISYYFGSRIETRQSYIQVIASGHDLNYEVIKDNYAMMIEGAREKICIQTPYFIPDESLFNSIKNAAIAGIEVIIMIPCKPDHPFVYWATWSYVGALLKYGVRVFIYNDGFLHTKGIVVDSKICCYGTANMDIRSFRLNYEVNLMIYDREVAGRMEAIFYQDLNASWEITFDKYEERSLRIKLKEQFSRLFSEIL